MRRRSVRTSVLTDGAGLMGNVSVRTVGMELLAKRNQRTSVLQSVVMEDSAGLRTSKQRRWGADVSQGHGVVNVRRDQNVTSTTNLSVRRR